MPAPSVDDPELADLVEAVRASYGVFHHRLSGVDSLKHARDALDPAKAREKFELLRRFTGDLRGQRLLDVGSGFGVFVAFTRRDLGVLSFGVEPGGSGYEASLPLSRRLLARLGLEPGLIVEGVGENLPFADSSFDAVYSTNVLEHVHSPEVVLAESARVLRPGGIAQFVAPNYGSFWEGHYGLFWPPHCPRWLGKLIVGAAGRDPAFVDTLTLVTAGRLRRAMHALADRVEVLDWGEGLFHERLTSGVFSTWASLGRVKRVVDAMRRLGLARVASWVLRRGGAFAPIVLTFRRR